MPQPKRKTTKADAPAETDQPAVFILDQFDDPNADDVVEREIPMKPGEYLGGKFLRVTLTDLTARQVRSIPTSGSLEKAYRAMWRYVRDWSVVTRDEDGNEVKVAPFQRKNPQTGELVTLPAPGNPRATEMVGEGREWELIEMHSNEIGSQILTWLVNPGAMRLASEEGKKRSRALRNGDTPLDGSDTDTT